MQSQLLSLELHLASLSEKGFEKLVLGRLQRINTRDLNPLSFPHPSGMGDSKDQTSVCSLQAQTFRACHKEEDIWK